VDSMKGKTVVITGPTSGIGKEIAVGLASQGAELVLGCRDLKGEGELRMRSRAGRGRTSVSC